MVMGFVLSKLLPRRALHHHSLCAVTLPCAAELSSAPPPPSLDGLCGLGEPEVIVQEKYLYYMQVGDLKTSQC